MLTKFEEQLLLQPEEELKAEDIVRTKHSDHHMTDVLIKTDLGLIHAYSLNLLHRQYIFFAQQEPLDNIYVRINCPLSWFNQHANANIALLYKGLELYGKTVRPLPEAIAHSKQQLELIDIDTQLPTKTLPEDLKGFFHLESEEEFLARMFRLGELVGRTMMNSIQNNQITICCIQELENDPEINAAEAFRKGLRCHGHANFFIRRDLNDNSLFVPAIVFNKDQLQVIDHQKINKCFKLEMTKLIQGDRDIESIGSLYTETFKLAASDHEGIFLVASYHGDFSAINQPAHQSLQIMKKLVDLVKQHGAILAGDFNLKINTPHESQSLGESIKASDCGAVFKPTEPKLQLHDTLDAILVPTNYLQQPAIENKLEVTRHNSPLLPDPRFFQMPNKSQANLHVTDGLSHCAIS
jgi:hypothetical protein